MLLKLTKSIREIGSCKKSKVYLPYNGDTCSSASSLNLNERIRLTTRLLVFIVYKPVVVVDDDAAAAGASAHVSYVSFLILIQFQFQFQSL